MAARRPRHVGKWRLIGRNSLPERCAWPDLVFQLIEIKMIVALQQIGLVLAGGAAMSRAYLALAVSPLLAAALIGCGGPAGDQGADYELVPEAERSPHEGGPELGYSTPSQGGSSGDTDALPARNTEPSSSSGGPRDGSAGGTPTDDPAPRGPVHYSGKLAATAAKSFGGGSFCNYTVTMKEVSVDLEVTDKIVKAEVANVMVEKIVGACSKQAASPNAHSYSLPADTNPKPPSETKETVTMAGRYTNGPASILRIDLVETGADVEATLVWKRDDNQAAPLMWTISGKVTLKKM
jgi:hypothetical protein